MFSLFIKINLFLTTALYTLFLFFNKSYTVGTFILSTMGSISTAATLVLIIYILFYLLRYMNKTGLLLTAFVFILVDVGLIVDFFIHRLYNFHINAMVINILTSPAAADSIQLGLAPYLVGVSVIVMLILFQWGVLRFIHTMHEGKIKAWNKVWNKKLVVPLLLIVLIEKISFGLATLNANTDIVSKFSVIPLYQPLTFNRFAYKYFGVEARKEVSTYISSEKKIHYPLDKLSISDDAKKTNIFIFASDSVRASVIDEETTPNLDRFSKESLNFRNHISGGNATRFGIFSLMYGLNATYWFRFLDASRGSILFDSLESLGYQINISSSTSTQWPEFRQTCYAGVRSCIHDDFDGTPAQKDAQNMQAFKGWINKQDITKPLFSFVFMDAPHGRSYPKEHRRYLPDDDGHTNYLSVDEQTVKTVLFNQYKNSISYNDALFSEMIQVLKDKGLYEDSIIIYTSDHGQEFYEYGNFGHNSAFSQAQVRIPLMIKFPDQRPREISHLTSHVDIVPTLLHYIGIETPSEAYSNGYDLLSEAYKRPYAFVANWNFNAVYTDKNTMVFSNLPNKVFSNEVRKTKNYALMEQGSVDSGLLLKVLDENRKFLK